MQDSNINYTKIVRFWNIKGFITIQYYWHTVNSMWTRCWFWNG